MARRRDPPASKEEVESWFDKDGRLVREAKMRQTLFEVGVDSTCRRRIWKFLFGIYPPHSTYLEQRTHDLEHRARYKALRERWEVLDRVMEPQEPEGMSKLLAFYLELSDDEACDMHTNQLHVQLKKNSKVDEGGASQACCDVRRGSIGGLLDDEDALTVLAILEPSCRVFANKEKFDIDSGYPKAKRIILRDVHRTDRNNHYFSHKRNLRKVYRILLVYALFHPDVGYAQGMNDILVQFLLVTHSEVDSYWMFSKHMEEKRKDFMEATMLKKIDYVKSLLEEVDSSMFQFFKASECQDFLFCHRLLLLDFKRELQLEDSIRLLEILCSHYLELNSDKAMAETDKALNMYFVNDQGGSKAGGVSVNLNFTFGIFVCVSILLLHKEKICSASDAASIYGTINGLAMQLDLNAVLDTAEGLFYKYCTMCVDKSCYVELNC